MEKILCAYSWRFKTGMSLLANVTRCTSARTIRILWRCGRKLWHLWHCTRTFLDCCRKILFFWRFPCCSGEKILSWLCCSYRAIACQYLPVCETVTGNVCVCACVCFERAKVRKTQRPFVGRKLITATIKAAITDSKNKKALDVYHNM